MNKFFLLLFGMFLLGSIAASAGVVGDHLHDDYMTNWSLYTVSNISRDSAYDTFDNSITRDTHWVIKNISDTNPGSTTVAWTNGVILLHVYQTEFGSAVSRGKINLTTKSELFRPLSMYQNQMVSLKWASDSATDDCTGGNTDGSVTFRLSLVDSIGSTKIDEMYHYYADTGVRQVYGGIVNITMNTTSVIVDSIDGVRGVTQTITNISGMTSKNLTLEYVGMRDCTGGGWFDGYFNYSFVNSTTPRLSESNMVYFSRGELVAKDFIETNMSIQKVTVKSGYTIPVGTGLEWWVSNDNGTNWYNASIDTLTSMPYNSTSNRTTYKLRYLSSDVNYTPVVYWVNLTVDRSNYTFDGNWYYPVANNSYSTSSLNFNFSIDNSTGNSMYPVNCTLYQNAVANRTIIGITNNSINEFALDYDVNSQTSFNYYFACIGRSGTGIGSSTWVSSNRTIYVDSVDPDIYTNFVNLSSVFYQNLVGQFNFSDTYLYSFNVSVDGLTVANMSGMVVSDYSYNLSFNPVNLSVGVHALQVRVSDGHTARAIPAWSVQADGGSKAIRYDFGGGWVEIVPVWAKDFSSAFSTVKQKDRYVFRYVRDLEEKKVHGGDLVFRVSSSHPVSVVSRSDYPGWLIVEGLSKWVDFSTDADVKGYSVSVVDDRTVDVTVRGVTVDDVTFSSIGDLNVVTQTYSFYKGNYSVGWTSLIPESTAAAFTINFTRNSSFVSDINANLFYNVTNYSATKTVYEDSVFFTKTLTPWGLIDNSSLNVSIPFFWNFTVVGSSNFSNVSASNSQVVYKLLINNCSQYTSTVALVLNLWDEETGLPVNGTVASTVRVWFAGYSSLYRDYSFNFVGLNGSANSTYSICIYPPSASYLASTDTLSYDAVGYVGRNYVFENLSLSNVSGTINLYLLDDNSSSDVTLTVFDNNGQEVEGELIQVLKYDPGTGVSTLVEAVRSDDNGEALVSLVLAGPYYWFVLSQGGVIHLQTSPGKLITSEKFFTISLYGDLYESYRKLFNVYYDLVFVNSSNTFRFVWADTQNLVRSACLNVSREDAFGETILFGECVESAAGSISYTLVEDTAGKVYVGTGWIDTNTEFSTYYIEKIVASFRTSLQTYGKDGLVASLFLVLGVVGALVPGGGTLVIVGALIGSVMSVLLGLWHVSWLSVITIIILGGILLAKART